MESSEQERLIDKYMGFARNTAVKVVKSRNLPLEFDEAIQAAYEGLVKAATRFDIDKHDPEIGDLDTNFKSFAFLRIQGAVIDESRRGSFVRRRGLEKGLHFDMTSLDATYEGEDGEVPVLQLESVSADPDLAIDFQYAFDALSDREQRVVMGIAVGAKGAELATELGVSESRVSQIASEARIKMTEKMEALA